MSNETALVPAGQMTLADTMTLGATLAKSGYFEDAKEAAQAVVKILAGRELGFDPIASMTGIHIIKQRVTLSANMMAQAIKRSQVYDYRVVELTDDEAEIAFFERGEEVGRSVFSKADAQRAGTQNVNKFPRNMLFARAMSNGVKWFCPDVFTTAVYTPDELGASVDAEGEIIDLEPTRIERPAETTTTTPEPAQNGDDSKPHWLDGETRNGKKVSAMFWAWAHDEMGLTDAEVHTALNCKSVKEYTGSMRMAKEAILAGVNAASNADESTASDALEDVFGNGETL